MIYMREYSYREGDTILHKLIKSNEKHKKYVRTHHIEKKAKIRNINIKSLENMLLNKEPLGVLSSRDNRFKIYFPSESDSESDLIIIVAIEDDETIIGVTTYDDPKTKREGIK